VGAVLLYDPLADSWGSILELDGSLGVGAMTPRMTLLLDVYGWYSARAEPAATPEPVRRAIRERTAAKVMLMAMVEYRQIVERELENNS
jgi:hypothetical protein